MGHYWGPVGKSYRVIRMHGPTSKHSLDIVISTTDTSGMVLSRLTAFLVLIAITLQGAMAGMQENVIICMGGGHEHGPTEVVEHCDLECTHHNEWPTPATNDEHRDDCDCADIELALITLISTPRNAGHDIHVAPPTAIAILKYEPTLVTLPHRKLNMKDDPGGKHRIALIRTTRLIV
jgi:hypothetical protein